MRSSESEPNESEVCSANDFSCRGTPKIFRVSENCPPKSQIYSLRWPLSQLVIWTRSSAAHLREAALICSVCAQ